VSDEPRVSIVIPAYNEGASIVACLERIIEAVSWPCEVLVVVDFAQDSTLLALSEYRRTRPQLRVVVSTYGRGPANAIRFGFDTAIAPVVVVTMADGSDDPQQIEGLARLVERGVAVAAASRYTAGGQQVGGPLVKGLMSKAAGRSLHLLARVGTTDATNSYKAYQRDFVRAVGIDSRFGFEIGLELTAKAKRLGLPIAELPTIWLERDGGVSNFKVWAWVPKYLQWYRFAFGARLTVDELRRKAASRR
jgi:dolichol-phosphate mannosyltransferase